MFTKSGLMVGLGETKEQVLQVMDDMRAANVDFLTIGQYLQPTVKHAAVDRFVHPDEFETYARIAKAKRVRAKHIGAKAPRSTLAGSKASRFKKTLDGRVIDRATGKPVGGA